MQAELKIEVHKWLINAGLRGVGERDLVQGFCERLAEVGVKLARFAVASDVLHPVHEARGIIWRPETGALEEFYAATDDQEDEAEEWERSPFYYLIHSNDPSIYRNLDDTYRRGEFPLLDKFKSMGHTGYLAVRVDFGDDGSLSDARGLISSFSTNVEGGFSADKQKALTEVSHTFALAYKSMMEVFTGRTLMQTYLGHGAAQRVLMGAIRRGSAEAIDSVLWYSDLRGFTRIADTAPREQLMPLLNDYADCLVTAIHKHGGEVLKFIGDGVLAMFSHDDPAKACINAIEAATLAEHESDILSARRRAEGLPTSDFCIGLHRGIVFYGNIGSRERLDFTVIGPAVNEVARIENMCRNLDQRVIVSSDFAGTPGLASDKLLSLGRYALKGVSRPQELFTLDSEVLAPVS